MLDEKVSRIPILTDHIKARLVPRSSGGAAAATRLDPGSGDWYCLGMKTNTKSSITLPAEELKLVLALQARLKAKSKVEVVRRGLRLLRDVTDRESLRIAYRRASRATRASLSAELPELDPLASEGLDES